MTSNDRHASHNSATRVGQNAAPARERHLTLTSITTNNDDSRLDLTSPYAQDNMDTSYSSKVVASTMTTQTTPYTPGMRSLQQTTSYEYGTGEIQMQSFQDGLPPPPPISHSWKRIDQWVEGHYQELYDNLSEGCTQNDINELEHDLDCTLPQEVRESLQFHDGQERGGLPTGIIFGSMLMDCEEIVQEWKNWRVVADEYLARTTNFDAPRVPLKAFGVPSSSSSSQQPVQQGPSSMWREELQDRQDSQPVGAIQKAYAHPAWIPLVRDWGGNNLAVDLAPGPAGRWGQIILMGRDYDCKYVVARSWSAFLAVVADDFTSQNTVVNEETGDLKLLEFKKQGVEPAYFDILRWRADQKYGRKRFKKQPVPNGHARGTPVGSPANGRVAAASPEARESDRGRHPQQKANGKGPAQASPRGRLSNPLARVAEEAPNFIKIHTTNTLVPSDSLLMVDKDTSAYPVLRSEEDEHSPQIVSGRKVSLGDSNKENRVARKSNAGVLQNSAADEADDEMKTVEL